MDNNEKKVLEQVVFWLAVAHFIISSVMTYLNCGKGKKKSQKKSQKKKDLIEQSVDYVETLINNNCFMWFISALVCIAIAVLSGLCIWMDEDDDDSKK